MKQNEVIERSRPRADEESRNICGENIARLRTERGMSRADLARKMDITLGGVSAWEYGRTRPDIDSIRKLCRIFGVSGDCILGIDTGEEAIAPSEKDLIKRYLLLPEKERGYISDLIDLMLSRQKKAAPAPETEQPVIRLISVSVNPLAMCAGTGIDLADQGEGESMLLKENELLTRCDEIVRISGRSMEPAFYDGDLAMVEHCERIEEGETGVFVIDGEGMIKVYRTDGLHPLNPDYKVIRPSKNASVRCFGRVLGKVTEDMQPTKAEIRRFRAQNV